MADFCKSCAEEMWGPEIPSDLRGLITQEEVDKGHMMRVLCEGCGLVHVDPDGSVIKVIATPETLAADKTFFRNFIDHYKGGN